MTASIPLETTFCNWSTRRGTAVVVPAAGVNLAHCQVDFTDVSLEGRRYGYPEDQTSKFRIRVAL